MLSTSPRSIRLGRHAETRLQRISLTVLANVAPLQWKHRLMLIVLAWIGVLVYLAFGGLLFESIEADNEATMSAQYCLKIDQLLKRLSAAERRSFSSLLVCCYPT